MPFQAASIPTIGDVNSTFVSAEGGAITGEGGGSAAQKDKKKMRVSKENLDPSKAGACEKYGSSSSVITNVVVHEHFP